MWIVNEHELKMTENDFGIALPVIVTGAVLGNQDNLKFTFKNKVNGELILEKDYNGITDNTVDLMFTEEESAKFTVGIFVYSLDWYQNGVFKCNLIESALLRVGDKA